MCVHVFSVIHVASTQTVRKICTGICTHIHTDSEKVFVALGIDTHVHTQLERIGRGIVTQVRTDREEVYVEA